MKGSLHTAAIKGLFAGLLGMQQPLQPTVPARDLRRQKSGSWWRKMFTRARRSDRAYLSARAHMHGRYSIGEVFRMTDGRQYVVHKDGSFRRVRPA